MSERVVDENTEQRLISWALGELPDEERAELEAELDASPELARAAAAIAEDFGALPLALEPVQPAPALRERVLESTRGESRFARFVDRLTELLGVARDKAKALVDGIDVAGSFEPSMIPGVSLYHLEGGVALSNAIVGFVKIDAGGAFPQHQHIGEEITFVVQGAMRDSDGTVYRAGAEIRNAGGTEHELAALDGPDLIYLSIIHDGVRIGVIELKPGDPRI